MVAGLKADGLYDLLQRAVAQPELSVSVDPSLLKRRKVAIASVASPIAQELEVIAPKPKKGVSVQWGPHLSIPPPTGKAIPAQMEPLRIILGDTR